MKIIAKRGQKDYYDYLVGLYGEDPKVVLDRREYSGLFPFVSTTKIAVYICGDVYTGLYDDGSFYFGEQLKKKAVEAPKSFVYSNYTFRKPRPDEVYTSLGWIRMTPSLDTRGVNVKENCPIVLAYGNEFQHLCKYPILQEIGINKVLPAFSIYMKLIEWLAPKDDAPVVQSNENKIVSAGFDLKTSFRKEK